MQKTANLSPDVVGGKHGSCRIRRFTTQKEHTSTDVCSFCLGCSNYLSSRVVSNKVLSAQASLTSVFGMRTGGPRRYRHRIGIYSRFPLGISSSLRLSPPQFHNRITLSLTLSSLTLAPLFLLSSSVFLIFSLLILLRSSPRPISIG